MFNGLPEYMAILCELLVKDNKMDEAKGIYVRNGLKVNDFSKLNGGKKLGDDI
jgi:hypothetical protein